MTGSATARVWTAVTALVTAPALARGERRGERIVWRPLTMTLVLHAMVVFSLGVNWPERATTVKPEALPRAIQAVIVEALPQPPEPETTVPEPVPATTVPEPGPELVAVNADEMVIIPEPEELEPEPEQPTAAERARAEREEQLRNQLDDLLQQEDEQMQRRTERLDDQQRIASYTALIADTVKRNWSRPPNARNGMEAVLQIQLVPSGKVVSVAVLRGSGLDAFDRSALRAVERAGQFPELQDLPPRLFEGNFRRLQLKFKPEDLRH